MKHVLARRLSLLLCGLGWVMEPATGAEVRTPNLLVNGGFEDGNELPAWWHRHPQENVPGNRHVRDTTVAHDGGSSGLLVAVNPEHVGSAGVQWNRYGIPIDGIRALAISYWVKTEGVPASGAGCHFYGSQREHLGFVPIRGPSNAEQWQQVQRTIRVPEGAKTMGFALYAADGGKTWYDDIRVEPDLQAAARWAAVCEHFAIHSRAEETSSFRVALAHSLQKIPRREAVTDGEIVSRIELEAARDETESFQLVIIPEGHELKDVVVETTSLAGPGGELPLSWSYVEYVKTAPPKYPVQYVGWWPDPLLPPRRFAVPADQRQPLWFQVDVPADAQRGEYTGQVTIRCGEQQVVTPVKLTVRSFALPRPGTLATPFGLYASALVRGYEAKSSYRDAMPLETFARWCEFLGVRRLAPKNVAREYIDVKKSDGHWRAHLDALDRTVAKLAPRYFPANSFCLHRLPVAANLWNDKPKPDPTALADLTGEIATEWKHRNLSENVYIYGMDEPRRTDYPFLREVYTKVREAAPGFPVMQTIGDPHPDELVGLVDIWCPLTPRANTEFYQQRRAAGEQLWTYVCCSPLPPHANFFIDQPAIDHRVLFWQVHQLGATGLLYWCTCWWNGLPVPADGDKGFPHVPLDLAQAGTYRSFKVNGDGWLLYPGPDWTPYSSIRLEVIRDGIEDYEYLALLAKLVDRAQSLPADQRLDATLLAEAKSLCQVPSSIAPRQSMTGFTKEPNDIFRQRKRIGDMIETLSAATERLSE